MISQDNILANGDCKKVIRLLAGWPTGRTIAQIATQLKLPRTTTRNTVNYLLNGGFLRHGKYNRVCLTRLGKTHA